MTEQAYWLCGTSALVVAFAAFVKGDTVLAVAALLVGLILFLWAYRFPDRQE